MGDNKKSILDVFINNALLNSILNILKKLLPKEKKGRKIYNGIIIILFLVLGALSYNLLNSAFKQDSEKIYGNNVVPTQGVKDEKFVSTEVGNYKKKKEEELTTFLNDLQGGGKITVIMHFESSEEKVIATNINDSVSLTEEADDNGGTRKINTNQNGRTVVTLNEGDKTKALVTKVVEPKVIGVVVTAEGAADSLVRQKMKQAILTLYDLKSDQVEVYPIGCEYKN
ncbi:stage III sporulation protein AG [Oceanirhabdus sp. W0125-5]|uniref:stage III sporulation protein AG n=1 Tax=Oceanirhabdus sp. W0125-5 TaxID=2999116 RepID=UPI0022F2D9BA|nr:stage III sporulation protein AG [Oceanirhabdus sp. W0125-5]WBW95329.1 stage III sporulation protein AG [Oceanirhabdus sp. W0125-5]